ncbi:MAG: tetratricopeptide repeat protein [Alphaproteobacteria bacterium]|nr:tetratricopeptide repeat protein [Alphaproteobacteria bacterium]
MNKKHLFITAAASAFILHGCSGSGSTATGSYQSNGGYSSASSKKTSIIERAIEKALKNAQNDQERLGILAQMHARDPNNQAVAIHYAQALRNDEQIQASKRILAPFTVGENKTSEALTEMAITNIALGEFKNAEFNAIEATDLSPNNGRAYLAMGTALDALGRHQDAEIAFREGIENWQGDPAPILNNLALNLASQGQLQQALEILEKAKKISPHRMEIERNLRIISTLLETTGPTPPKPSLKPEVAETKTVEEEPKSEEETGNDEEKVQEKDDSDEPTPEPKKKPSFSINE